MSDATHDRESGTGGIEPDERPVVEDLRLAGFDILSVWDLNNRRSEPYVGAFPILLNHLEFGDYPDRVKEGIASALETKDASPHWVRIRDLYVASKGPEEAAALAAVLRKIATVERVDDLLALAENPTLPDRILFLSPIWRLGKERGRAFVRSLVGDPEMGQEALRLTEGKR